MFHFPSLKKKGFTFIEFLVVIGVLVILVAISAPAFHFFQRESDLNNSSEEIINTLRRAQNKTLASEGASRHGVYFDSSTSPHQYTLFKGADYASRNVSFDEVRKLPKGVEIYGINLGGENEVVFDRVAGTTAQSGNVSLRLETDPTETRVIYIEGSGLAGTSIPSVPTNGRIEDSRHVHFDYSRVIDTTTESITLTFNATTTKEIPITQYLKDEQFYWEGEVEVGEEIQRIKIHTHRLNNPDTQFCIHRDRRYNNKSLIITISDDISGSLIEYSADGLATSSTSIYVSNLTWQ